MSQEDLHQVILLGLAADDMGIPCEGECAIGEYPKMPASVHPGVLTGQVHEGLARQGSHRAMCARSLHRANPLAFFPC